MDMLHLTQKDLFLSMQFILFVAWYQWVFSDKTKQTKTKKREKKSAVCQCVIEIACHVRLVLFLICQQWLAVWARGINQMAVMVEMLCARCSRVCAVWIADFKSFRVRGTILVITITGKSWTLSWHSCSLLWCMKIMEAFQHSCMCVCLCVCVCMYVCVCVCTQNIFLCFLRLSLTLFSPRMFVWLAVSLCDSVWLFFLYCFNNGHKLPF